MPRKDQILLSLCFVEDTNLKNIAIVLNKDIKTIRDKIITSINKIKRSLKHNMKKEFLVKPDLSIYGYELLHGLPSNVIEDFEKFIKMLEYVKRNGNNETMYHINLLPKTMIFYYKDLMKIAIPDNVVIELVELNSSISNEVIGKIITSLNLKISLDDFGNGSSNFHRLDLPNIVSVKFERTLWNSTEFPGIAKELVEKLKNKGIITMAEKIEKEEEMKRALEIGFDVFQGYLFQNKIEKTI